MQKKLKLAKQLNSGSHGKNFKVAVEMNGAINGINGKVDEAKVQDIENIVPDIAQEQKTIDRILDKTR